MRRRMAVAAAVVLAALIRSAGAADLLAADGYDVRWDNTLRYSMAVRVAPRDSYLTSEVNSDDGDRNFAAGLVSNRIDLVSQFDVAGSNVGLHIGMAAWYDTVYHARTDNGSPGTYNSASAPPSQFPRGTRNLQGQYVDLIDTFAYGNFDLGGTPVSVRVGRQTLLWGESLFFSENGIAAAQSPVDSIRNLSAPGTYSTSVFMPVNQVSLSVQPTPDVSFDFYYQLEWRKERLPGAGSYFSYTDYEGAGAERLIVSPGQYLYRGRDYTPPAGGQFGIALRTSVEDVGIGFYVLRYNAMEPQVRLWPGLRPDPAIGKVGEYDLVYPKGIDVVGLSFNGNLGDSTIAGEISARRHMPLVSISSASPYPASNGSALGYAAGDTLHAQSSSVTTFGRGSFWDRADFSVEVAANELLDVTRNYSARDTSRDTFAMSLRALFEPRYFEVLPNLDISFPLGVGYNAVGRSSVDETQYAGSGDLEIGVAATYLSTWKASLTLTSFFGAADRQPLADRDFMLLSVERTL